MQKKVLHFFTKYYLHLVTLLISLNIIDAVLTLYWVTHEIAQEVNPLMEYLLGEGPLLFLATKIILVTSGSWLLWRFRESRSSWAAITCCLAVYLWVMTIHIQIAAQTF